VRSFAWRPDIFLRRYSGGRYRNRQVLLLGCPKPIEFGSVGQNWENVGWRVNASITKLLNKIRSRSYGSIERSFRRSHLLRLSLPRVNLYWIIRLHRFTNDCAKVTARVDTPLFSRSETRSRSSHTFPIPSPIAHLQVRTGIHARISGLFLQTYEVMSDVSSGGENGPARTRRHCNCQYGSNSLRRERAATIFDCPTTEQHYPFQTYLPHGR
jgi:hypothetical protein